MSAIISECGTYRYLLTRPSEVDNPDLGTALVYIFAGIPMLLWRGVRPFYLFILFAPLISMFTAYNLTLFSGWMLTVVVVFIA